MGKKIIFTVTNDLVFDQRMHRICSSMSKAGYEVTLVGRGYPDSPPLFPALFQQVRLPMKFKSGKLFYIEYNFKLYRFLLNTPADAICAIDLDTIIPVYLVTQKKGIRRMYDAHEYFTEMIEVKRRWHIHFIWKQIEKWLVPKFTHGYTVGGVIAKEFKSLYGVDYALVRNIPVYREPIDKNAVLPEVVHRILSDFNLKTNPAHPTILYQGAINEGRALPQLISAFESLDARLLMAGTGNLEHEIKKLIIEKGLEHKIYMCGNVAPEDLRCLTAKCYTGITIFDALSKNQYYSLGNKFFDYIMAHLPQVCVNYPEYAALLEQYPVAVPLVNTETESIALSLNKLLNDPVLYKNLQINAREAAKTLHWALEEKTLLKIWQNLFEIDKS